MPLYRRLPFQRNSRERRSLHVPATAVKSRSKGGGVNLTSLDLELDLAAQQSRLKVIDIILILKKIIFVEIIGSWE